MSEQNKNGLAVNQISEKTKRSMKTRIISAVVASLIAIPCVILGDWPFFVLAFVVAGIAFFEVVRCLKAKYSIYLYIITIILGLLVSFWPIFVSLYKGTGLTGHIYETFNNISIPIIICFFGAGLLFFMTIVDENFGVKDACAVFTLTVLVAMGIQAVLFVRYRPCNVIPSWATSIKQSGSFLNLYDNLYSCGLFAYAIFGTFFTDIGAYFVGVFFGKRKINERISPNKTIEGFFGGIVISFIVSLAFGLSFAACGRPFLPVLDINHWYVIVIISLIMPIMATLGDFVFSSIKRSYQIKDYGFIMPGHGGVLDRIDSLLFTFIAVSLLVGAFSGFEVVLW